MDRLPSLDKPIVPFEHGEVFVPSPCRAMKPIGTDRGRDCRPPQSGGRSWPWAEPQAHGVKGEATDLRVRPLPIGHERSQRSSFGEKSFAETKGGRICFFLNEDLLRDLDHQEVSGLDNTL